MPSQTGSIDLTAQVLANNNAKDYSDNVIDNLEIGGRNLLRNTNWNAETIKNFTTASIGSRMPGDYIGIWYKESNITLSFTENGYLNISTSATGGRYGIVQDVYLESGEYTLSASADDSGCVMAIGTSQWPSTNVLLITDKSRKSVSFEVETASNYRVYIYDNNDSTSTIKDPSVNWVKLEKGNKATDWTPAPEDQEALVTSTRNWYATCDTAAATVAKVATTTDEGFELREGVVVDVKFANTNSGAVGSLTLNVNDTGAKSIKTMYNNSLANLTTAGQLYAGLVVRFVYSGTYWIAATNYNSDTVDRKRINNAVIVAENVTAYAICGRSGTGHKKLVSGLAIDISYPIAYLYAGNISGQSYAVASGSTTTTFYTSIPGVNLQSTKASWTGTQYAMCYIKGTLSGTTFTVHSDVFTTTVPTSDDGFAYIPIGIMVSTTQVNFDCDNTVYMYRNGSFHKADTVSNYINADSTGIRIASASPSTQNQRLELTSSTLKMYDASNYQRLKLDSTNGVIIGKESYGHTQVTDTGLFIYDVSNKKRAQVDNNGLSVYLSDGTTSIANFGEVTRIGKAYDANANDNESHMELDYHSLQLIDKNNKAFFYVSDLRGADGSADIVDVFYGDGSTRRYDLSFIATSSDYTITLSNGNNPNLMNKFNTYFTFNNAPASGIVITVTYKTTSSSTKAFTFGERKSNQSTGARSFVNGVNAVASGTYSAVLNGYGNTSSGKSTISFGKDSTASGDFSIAGGKQGAVASGESSVAFGYNATASGDGSFAIGTSVHATGMQSCAIGGTQNTASGIYSHAEGLQTTAQGQSSHSEGTYCKAQGPYSHAQGYNTRSSGSCSEAAGSDTIAAGAYQTVIGKFNESDASGNNGLYAFIIGNGTADDARSNAFAVGWDGTVTTARDILVTSTSGMSGIMTAASGITIDIFKFCQRGNVASILLRAKKSTVTAANTAISVGTVVADRRPPFECAGPGTSGVGDCWVDDTGSVKFRSTSQIAANANFYVRVTYPVV